MRHWKTSFFMQPNATLKMISSKDKRKLCQTGIESGEGRGDGAVMMMGPKWAVGKWLGGHQSHPAQFVSYLYLLLYLLLYLSTYQS